MGSRIKRKQYIVDKQQYKVSGVIVLYNVIAIFLAGFLVFLPSFIGLSSATESGAQAAAAQEILVLHKRFWPAIIIVALVLGTHSIFFFHRLFGPLYRFKSSLQKVTQGDLSQNFELRQKDFLLEEKVVINEMITTLRGNIMDLKQDNAHLVEAVRQLDIALENQDVTVDSVRQGVKEIHRKVEKVNQGLDKFKVA